MSTNSSDRRASLDTIVALAKRRGFVYPSSDIYGGLNGVYDFGPLGAALKQTIRAAWVHAHNVVPYDVVFIEGALLGPEIMWKASGHIDNFHDPMIDCKACKHRYRADDIDLAKGCPHCGKTDWTEVRQFNMMFSTQLGASHDAALTAYLRPETAQAIYVNVKNVLSTSRVRIPFGIGQVGKAFRNEITPKQFLFRMREFEQMELEWVCKEESALQFFDFWLEHRKKFYQTLGIGDKVSLREHDKNELAHYSSRTVDFEFDFPFGRKELEGIAYRGNFDLKQHAAYSGKELSVFDEETKQSFIPNIVECSVGVDRLFLALLCNAYDEDTADGEQRVVLRFAPHIAPVSIAFLPLSKQQVEPLEKIYREFKARDMRVQLDVTGSIGKRYRRQDEIGTPFCVTYDFESGTDNAVTVRYRDSMKQERMSIEALPAFFQKALAMPS